MGIELHEDAVAYRCNLVTLENGRMKSFSSGHISTDEAKILIDDLNSKLDNKDIHFFPGVSYRHVMIWHRGTEKPVCIPPHDITDREYVPYLPRGAGASFLLDIMHQAESILSSHSVNTDRVSKDKYPANNIWLWGQGRAPHLPSFHEKYGVTGVVISAVDLIRGLGKCAGLEPKIIAGATGFLDTNYEGKINAAIEALEHHEFA